MNQFIAAYTPETKAEFKASPLGQKFVKGVVPVFAAAMNGTVNELMVKQLGNYRLAVYDKAVERNFIKNE